VLDKILQPKEHETDIARYSARGGLVVWSAECLSARVL